MVVGGRALIDSTGEGILKGHLPELTTEGSSGVYFMRNAEGKKLSVFKPRDEEARAENNPLRNLLEYLPSDRGIAPGKGAARERIAYILDHPKSGPRSVSGKIPGFSGVPFTVMTTYPLERGGTSVPVYGSLQKFVENDGNCAWGSDGFPVDEVHRIAVLDIRMANTDRHGGNILYRIQGGKFHLIPIDHGGCLPDQFGSCRFCWRYWPQAEEHFSPETVEYIESLDTKEDIALLNDDVWELPLEIVRILHISTMLLKKGAKKNMTPCAIGNIMCRKNGKKSTIEEIVEQTINEMPQGSSEDDFLELVSRIMDSRLDVIASEQSSGSTAVN